jgi:diguanylate cyclase (GGDEF)-like protein
MPQNEYPARILVVEDERAVALDLRRALESQGYLVVGTASSCAQAIEQAAQLSPDVVLMDVHLEGGSDGIAAAAAIRAMLGTPIVYLSASADPSTVARALETRPYGYLAKPYNDLTLRSTIEVALYRHRLELTQQRLDQPRTSEVGTSDREQLLLEIIELQNEVADAKLDLERVLAVVVERAASLTGASGSVVELVEGAEMVYRAAWGSASGTLGLRLNRAKSLSGLCVERTMPLRSNDTEADPRVDRETCRRVGVASMACVPLLSDGTAIGVLKVLSNAKWAFTGATEALLGPLARIIATSIHQASTHERAVHDSLHDKLTGLLNRRAFDERIEFELVRHRRYRQGLCLAMFDLDGFKLTNDRYGHAAGDEALCHVAKILTECARKTDACFRLGGDEFALIMPNTHSDGALLVVERIAQAVAAQSVGRGTIGLSAGVVEANDQTAAELISAADLLLYDEKRLKAAGRTSPQDDRVLPP